MNLKQISNSNPVNYTTNRAPIPLSSQQQYNHNIILQSNPNQYRPQIQTQAKPINPLYNQNIQRLPIHLEERRMATEVNQSSIGKPQPSYIISNSDDVDDVIVRPISNMQLKSEQTITKAEHDLKQQQQQQSQQQQQPQQVTRPILESKIPSSVLQNSYVESNIPKSSIPSASALKQPEFVAKPIEVKKTPIESAKQNGTSPKPVVR